MLNHNVPFVSQHSLAKWKNISCGVASFKMLLEHSGKDINISYRDLGILLRVNVERQYKSKDCREIGDKYFGVQGVFFEDIIDYCHLINLKIKSSKNCDVKKFLKYLKLQPLMIGFNNSEYGHWCVAIGFSNESLYYLDPDYKLKRTRGYELKNFMKYWTKEFISINN